MKDLIKKVQLTSIIIILAIIFITFTTFYYPLKNELRDSYLENFKLFADVKVNSIEYFIERSLEATASLSSRTMIRNKIAEYKNGDISIEELEEYTEPRYKDGINVLNNVVGSFRIVEEHVIAEYNTGGIKETQKSNEVNDLFYEIKLENDEILLVVFSPILQEGYLLGQDVTYFNMKKYIEGLIKEKIKIEVIEEENIYENFNKTEFIETSEQPIFINSKEYIGYLYKIGETDKYIYAHTTKKDLYEPVTKVAMISHGAFGLGLIILVIVINCIVIKNSKKILDAVETSRDEYKEHAYRDSLTGVYSRRFLETWLESTLEGFGRKEDIYSIAIIDGDNFKGINDKYGHSTGDQVLIKIAKIIKESIREKDIIIRYGGDEFLVIFENCKIETANSVLKRIENKLKQTEEFDFCIEISYGVSEIKNKERFIEALNEADQCMYNCKKIKK